MPDKTKTKQEISLAPQGGPLAHADDAFCRTRLHFHLPAVSAPAPQTGQCYCPGANATFSATFTASVIPQAIDDYLHAPPKALEDVIRIGDKSAQTLDVTILPAAPGEENTGMLHAGEQSLSLTLHAEPAALDELIRYLRADRCPRLAVAASFSVPCFSGSMAPHSSTAVRLLHLRTCCPKGITPLKEGNS